MLNINFSNLPIINLHKPLQVFKIKKIKMVLENGISFENRIERRSQKNSTSQ